MLRGNVSRVGFSVIRPPCPVQEGSEILISEEDAVARAAETEAMKRADAALRERCMDQQLKARARVSVHAAASQDFVSLECQLTAIKANAGGRRPSALAACRAGCDCHAAEDKGQLRFTSGPEATALTSGLRYRC